MKVDTAQRLINRYLDGAATAEEREQLARAMRADPLLRAEFEDLESVHASTESLFRQLSLPENFSQGVMRRVQTADVPGDQAFEKVRMPVRKSAGRKLHAQRSHAHRQRARVYAVIATVSAAAAVMLAIGVFTGFFARTGIGVQPAGSTGASDLADGRRGGPDRGELNRTDSPTHQPSKASEIENRTDSETPVKAAPEVAPNVPDTEPDTAPAKKPDTEPKAADVTDTVVKEPEPAQPDTPSELPLPEPGDTVEIPEKAPEPEDTHKESQPDATVEEREERKTEAEPTEPIEPAERIRLGRILILNGKAELVGLDGESTSMAEEQELFEGDRIRTSINGLVLLQTDGGNLTLHRRSELTLNSDAQVTLQAGTVAADRDSGHTGSDIAVTTEDFTLYLNHGCAILERKRRGLVVQKAMGFASLSHAEFGTVLLEEQSGQELEVEFGKPAGEAKTKAFILPPWCSESRGRTVVQALASALDDREYASRERKYVDDRLTTRVQRLAAYPVKTDTLVDLLTRTLENKQFDGRTLIGIIGEVESAYLDVTELTPEVITSHARRAAIVAEESGQWREYFYRLMRPPVEPKAPPCPNDPKAKRKVKIPPVPDPDDVAHDKEGKN